MRRRSPSTSAAVMAIGFLLGVSGAAVGQEQWQWPEHAENLQVLPADTGGQQLRLVMFTFTRGLGVGCTHCHVGEVGQPLSTYDFRADTKANKERARAMFRMLNDIKDDLAKIEPSGSAQVNVSCYTCHRGRSRPTSLEEELQEAYADGGASAAVERYRELREQYYGLGTLDFSERHLNNYGYQLLRNDDVQGAIEILKLNAELFPESGNVWDSLAEAYLAEGRAEVSAIYYRKSLELDPDNDNALKQLEKIKESAP